MICRNLERRQAEYRRSKDTLNEALRNVVGKIGGESNLHSTDFVPTVFNERVRDRRPAREKPDGDDNVG